MHDLLIGTVTAQGVDMNRTIIVTDLTRFSDDRVCLAGVDPADMKLIRPMPYINQAECQRLEIFPGTRISADFRPSPTIEAPHTEDHQWQNIDTKGRVTSDEFCALLEATLSPSISGGFGVDVQDKVIPQNTPPLKSIITIKGSINLHPGYGGDLTKIRAFVTDLNGLTLGYLSITDLGFYRFAQKLQSLQALNNLDRFIKSQSQIFVRLGLGRLWKSEDGRKGFWIQINGIYTFPEFSEEIRSYE